MIHDLRSILDGWEYEPGKISVRKIIGRDGCEKIQTRVDLGVLQLEVRGRPDGAHPHGRDSMLDHCELRLREHLDAGLGHDSYTVSPAECRELRQEAHLYYQRFLSLFVLEEFEGVERDTARNLRVMDFCRRYAESPADRTALEPQRAYVLMMHTRGRVYGALQRGQHDAAIRGVEEGMRRVREALGPESSGVEPGGTEAYGAGPREAESPPELAVLTTLRTEVLRQLPRSSPARLRWELAEAVEHEDYELAAQLRDRLTRVEDENATG